MAVNGAINQTAFSGFGRYPKYSQIQELKEALTRLNDYSKNVINCNCAPSNCCQTNCTTSCQSCQTGYYFTCEAMSECSCEAQCSNCRNCNCGDDGS